MAGVEGFEPSHGDTKNRCLTTWLHPSNAALITLDLGPVQGWKRKKDENRVACAAARCARPGDAGEAGLKAAHRVVLRHGVCARLPGTMSEAA